MSETRVVSQPRSAGRRSSLAVLAVTWPDIASIVVAVTFGIRLLWTGLELIWAGIRGRVAQRILYTTTGLGDEPALASAILVTPEDAGDAALPLIAWSHGTTGVAEGCAPSLLGNPFEAGAMFTLEDAMEKGWSVIATDYIGLGTEGPHGYLVGHAALWGRFAGEDAADTCS